MDRHGNKLLITLVLFIVALITLWTPSRVYSSGGSGTTASIVARVVQQGPVCAAGDPDIGQNFSTPAKTLKRISRHLTPGSLGLSTFGDWVRWTGWIWATLYLRAGR